MGLPLKVYIFGDTTDPVIDKKIQQVYDEYKKYPELKVWRVRKYSSRAEIKKDIDWADTIIILGSYLKPLMIYNMFKYIKIMGKKYELR